MPTKDKYLHTINNKWWNKREFELNYIKELPETVVHNEKKGSTDISIIMQTYNSSKFLEQAINSVFSQSFSGKIQFLLIDDASCDNTPELIMEKIKETPKNIEVNCVFSSVNNKWKILGRNTHSLLRGYGLLLSKGKYICYLDSDDYWNDSTRLQKMFDFIESNNAVMLCRSEIQTLTQKTGKLSAQLGQSAFPIPSSWMMRNIWDKIPEAMIKSINDDIIQLHFLEKMGHIEHYENAGSVVYRLHDSGVVSSIDKKTKKKHLLNTKWQLFKMYKWSWPKLVLLKNIFAIWVKG